MTPDIVAYCIVESQAFLGPILRVYSVEGKKALALDGVYEALAHRRFSHLPYVMSPEAFVDIDDHAKTECGAHGIGIISPVTKNSQRYYIQLDSRIGRPDETEVDALPRDVAVAIDDSMPNSKQPLLTRCREAYAQSG